MTAYIETMKPFGNILLAIILAIISITADGAAVRRAIKDSSACQICSSVPCHEFALVKTAPLPDLTGQNEPDFSLKPAATPAPIRHIASVNVTAGRSNTSFMSNRNCVCVPLRL